MPDQSVRAQVARNLKRAIRARGISKSELSRSARISRNTLDMILAAERGTSIDVIARLAAVLDIQTAKLFAR